MSISQRADGRWCVKYRDALRPGRWRQKSFKLKADALAFEDSLVQDDPSNSRLTVAEAVLLYVKSRGLSESVQNAYAWLISGATAEQTAAKKRVGYAECIAGTFVDALTRRDLQMVRDAAADGGCSPATVNLWIARLDAAFNYAVTEGLVPANPWRRFKKLPQERNSMFARADDLLAVYNAAPPWLQWACRTALALCLRPGAVELFSLRWSAFDFAAGAVSVRMGKTKKTKTVYPPDWYLQEARARFDADGRDADAFVCRTATGLWGGHRYVNAWAAARKKAGVTRRCPFYALRHMAATAMLAAGADAAAVAAQLGHSSPAVTMSFYAHALPAAQKAAGSALPNAFGGAGGHGADLVRPGAEKKELS